MYIYFPANGYYTFFTKNVFSHRQRDRAFAFLGGHSRTEFKGNTSLLKAIVLTKNLALILTWVPH